MMVHSTIRTGNVTNFLYQYFESAVKGRCWFSTRYFTYIARTLHNHDISTARICTCLYLETALLTPHALSTVLQMHTEKHEY